jgi:quinol monooxygenase YgiN
MLVVVAAVPGQPDKRTEIVAALAACAAASRKDPGCRSYLFTSDVEDEHSYASIETWDDQASLDAHMQQPHTQALFAALADKVAAAPVITTYDVAEVR